MSFEATEQAQTSTKRLPNVGFDKNHYMLASCINNCSFRRKNKLYKKLFS
jgi:hypothetical protein